MTGTVADMSFVQALWLLRRVQVDLSMWHSGTHRVDTLFLSCTFCQLRGAIAKTDASVCSTQPPAPDGLRSTFRRGDPPLSRLSIVSPHSRVYSRIFPSHNVDA